MDFVVALAWADVLAREYREVRLAWLVCTDSATKAELRARMESMAAGITLALRASKSAPTVHS